MKKKMRMILITSLILCMVIGAACSTALAATQVNFGNSQVVVDTFNGVPAFYKTESHNSDTTYSCAAYVKR